MRNLHEFARPSMDYPKFIQEFTRESPAKFAKLTNFTKLIKTVKFR